MRFLSALAVAVAAPILSALAAPAAGAGDGVIPWDVLNKRENLCSLSKPPVLCTPNSSVTVEETALRAYQFYRAFVVDGDPRTMFSLMDSSYIVSILCSAFSV